MVVFRYGRLRLYLLKLLDDGPKHGYELIRSLESRFLGVYAPSAGTVYPRLQRLEAEGLVTHTTEGGRKVYALTEAGRAELRDRSGELAAVESDIVICVRDLAAGEPAGTGRRNARGRARPAGPPNGEPSMDWGAMALSAQAPRPMAADAADAATLVERKLSDFGAQVRGALREARVDGADVAAVAEALETSLDSAMRTLRRLLG
ncbi:MAG TPA: PadR family transcriptional regulator [Pilimelia sp.]|nr:PadR family transcriptional regulator [Pilimelia sp.]